MSASDDFKVKGEKGYIWVRRPEHPKANMYGSVMEHILVMEAYLGRPLPSGSVVHHRNRKKHDNSIENLLLLRNQDDHFALHRAMDANDSEAIVSYEAWALDYMKSLKGGGSEIEAKQAISFSRQRPAQNANKPKIILRRSKG